jgi:hypothetical protein
VVVPVKVKWLEASGANIIEFAEAKEVNMHGGLIEMKGRPAIGSIIELTNLTSTKIVSALVVSLRPSKQSEVLAVGIELLTPSESFWGATFRLKMATDDLLKLEKSIRSGGMDTRGAPGVSRRRRLRPQDLLGAARIAKAPGPPTGYGHGAFPAH